MTVFDNRNNERAWIETAQTCVKGEEIEAIRLVIEMNV